MVFSLAALNVFWQLSSLQFDTQIFLLGDLLIDSIRFEPLNEVSQLTPGGCWTGLSTGTTCYELEWVRIQGSPLAPATMFKKKQTIIDQNVEQK